MVNRKFIGNHSVLNMFGNATRLVYKYRYYAYDVFDNHGNFVAVIPSKYIIDFLSEFEYLTNHRIRFRNCIQHDYVI